MILKCLLYHINHISLVIQGTGSQTQSQLLISHRPTIVKGSFNFHSIATFIINIINLTRRSTSGNSSISESDSFFYSPAFHYTQMQAKRYFGDL